MIVVNNCHREPPPPHLWWSIQSSAISSKTTWTPHKASIGTTNKEGAAFNNRMQWEMQSVWLRLYFYPSVLFTSHFESEKHKLIHLLQAQREATPAVAAAATIACLKSAKVTLNVSLCGQKKGICDAMEDWVALETEMVPSSKWQHCKYF